mmetsp:Transcript_13364/g.30765  ORF Transcript_13364/g.30765 Transcript_13364/m.30765 type:complete len:390 (-) Transcript_13364:206-1375(-)
MALRTRHWLFITLISSFIWTDAYGADKSDWKFWDSSDVYQDKNHRPEFAHGMPIEVKKLMQNIKKEDQLTRAEKARRRQEERDPKIPRKVWQVYWEIPLTKVHQRYSETWNKENPEHSVTLCSPRQARSLVEEYYPELLSIYDSLGQESRQDLWSYLMVFKFGGTFATIDSTCELPLDVMILPDDNMVVGYQPQLASKVLQRRYGEEHHNLRLQNWCFASIPGHPILKFMIDYIIKNVKTEFCRENLSIDSLLRSGASPFNVAIDAFERNPVDGYSLRVAAIGTFALGQVWGKGDAVYIPCAEKRHGYGFWFDDRKKKHVCDCPTRRQRSRNPHRKSMNGMESIAFVRRRHIYGAGVRSLVKRPELELKRMRNHAILPGMIGRGALEYS